MARISENNLRDVLEVRRTLEELAVDLACQRMTEDELEELKKNTGIVCPGHPGGRRHADRPDR